MSRSAPSSVPPAVPLSDAELLAAFDEQRRQDAFAQLVTRHGSMVLAVCRSVLGNTADAEDAAQAVFLTLAQKSSLRLASLAGWLHRVAWYISARAAAARAVRQRHEKEAAAMAPQHTDPAASGFGSEFDPAVLHAALAGLPEKYRIPLILHHLEGRTQEETAALLGCRVGAVAMRLNRGRQLLRDRLSRRVARSVPAASVLAALVPIGRMLPPAFVATAAQAGTLAATQQLGATSIVSGTTLALSKGALNMLFWSKVKLVAAMIALVVLAGGTVGTYVALAQAPAAATQIAGGGLITALTGSSVTITRNSVPTTVTIDASTVIKVDGAVKTAADLKTGLYAMALGTGTAATEIRAYTPKPPATPQGAQIAGGGLITALADGSVTITRGDKPTTVTVNAGTVYKLDNKVVTLADLKTGLYAGAWGSGTTATEIRAYTLKAPATQPGPQAAQIAGGGNITALTETSVTITRGDKATTVAMDASTVVKIDGVVKTAGDLKTGLYAMAFGANGKAAEIRAYTPKPK